jgi:predicted nucleotidyltransferase
MLGGDGYPGSARHQRVLAAVVAHYAADPRVLAVVLFGSLARGNWDHYSDLDLDIVLADGVAVSPTQELERLCAALAAIGEQAAAIVPKRTEEGDVVLVSLLELSVRYHPLVSTSPNIVESLRLLWGRITEGDISTAGRANARAEPPALDVMRGRCVRALLEADVSLQRRRLWFAVEQLNLARDQIFALFAAARGAPRPLHAFQFAADERLSAQMAATLPTGTLAAAQQALVACLDLLEDHLDTIASGHITLSSEQREVLRQIRARQAPPGADKRGSK